MSEEKNRLQRMLENVSELKREYHIGTSEAFEYLKAKADLEEKVEILKPYFKQQDIRSREAKVCSIEGFLSLFASILDHIDNPPEISLFGSFEESEYDSLSNQYFSHIALINPTEIILPCEYTEEFNKFKESINEQEYLFTIASKILSDLPNDDIPSNTSLSFSIQLPYAYTASARVLEQNKTHPAISKAFSEDEKPIDFALLLQKNTKNFDIYQSEEFDLDEDDLDRRNILESFYQLYLGNICKSKVKLESQNLNLLNSHHRMKKEQIDHRLWPQRQLLTLYIAQKTISNYLQALKCVKHDLFRMNFFIERESEDLKRILSIKDTELLIQNSQKDLKRLQEIYNCHSYILTQLKRHKPWVEKYLSH